METFEELAEKSEPFTPQYTEEFRKYIEDSIAKSKRDEAIAIETASKMFING